MNQSRLNIIRLLSERLPSVPPAQLLLPSHKEPEQDNGSIVSITSNCIVRRHTINNTLDVEFKNYPGSEVYKALAEQGFKRRKGKERTFWIVLTDTSYQFALRLCQGREEAGTSAVVEKAGHAVKADEAQTINEERVFAVVDRAMNGRKIGIDNLSDELKEELSKTKLVQYDLPPLPTVAFDKNNTDPQYQKICDNLMRGLNVLLVGGAGTGKTTLAKMAAGTLGRPWITINCSQWTSPTEIIGGQTIMGWQEGKLINAWKQGALLILDELPKLDPNTAGLLNDALAEAQKPAKDAVIENARGEKFTRHEKFCCIATGNIYPNQESGSYGANNKQDLSLLDRFAGAVYWIEANPEGEINMLQNVMIWSIFDKLRTEIERLKYEAQVSRRIMIAGRTAYDDELYRIKHKTDIKPDDGHTLKSVIDSFLSTFNPLQQKNLKDAIQYKDYIEKNQYRKMDKDKPLFY